MFLVVLRTAVGLALLVAGAPKLRDTARFARSVRAYRVLPGPVADAVGRALPFAEVIVGAALVLGVATRAASAVAVLMFLAFATGLTINLARGRRDLDCGCFAFGHADPDAARISWFHAGRAAALAVAALPALLWATEPVWASSAAVGGAAAGVVIVAAVFAAGQVAAVTGTGPSRLDGYLDPAGERLARIQGAL